MVAEDCASGTVATSLWLYCRGLGIQTAADGQIEPDFSLSGHTSPSVISEAAPSFRLVLVVIDAIHRSAAGFLETDRGARPWTTWTSSETRHRVVHFCAATPVDFYAAVDSDQFLRLGAASGAIHGTFGPVALLWPVMASEIVLRKTCVTEPWVHPIG